MRTRSDILAKLPWSAERGLSTEAVAQSRALFGANVLTSLPREPIWRKFLQKFDEPIIKILLAAALLSMLVDLFKAEPVYGGYCLGAVTAVIALAWLSRLTHWLPSLLCVLALALFAAGLVRGHILVEGMAVMIAVILATGVAFLSEAKSDREFELLNARKESVEAKVLRDGAVHAVFLEDVVVGDVVLLEMGDEVSADGRLLRSTELYLDQSLMTGESEPVRKHVDEDLAHDGPEQPSCLYRGTQVVDGVGTMVVTEVGNDTYLGQIARRLSEPAQAAAAEGTEEDRIRHKLTIDKNLTPLQLKLKNLAALISRAGYVAAVLIFLAQFVRGLLKHEIYWPHDAGNAANVLGELLGYFVTMVIIIVVAVPEGLPMSVTVSLALAMRKMTRANCLVRQLVACETIGSATVICSDKTGTLTQNKMRVERVSLDETVKPAASVGRAEVPELIVLDAAVNSTANLEEKDGKLLTVGNTTEGALLQWLRGMGLDHVALRAEFEPLYQLHFSSERKHMTTVVDAGRLRAQTGSDLLVLVKGSPEWVLAHCHSDQAADGSLHALDAGKKSRIQGLINDAARRAMRTLAFAWGRLPADTPRDEETLHNRRETLDDDLIYAGFVAIRDPLREDVKEAIAECRKAGIAIKIVTGDNVETARAIGHEVGLVEHADDPIDTPGSAVMTSPRFNELSDEDLKRELPGMRILARAKPLDKLRLVRLLQDLGETVAVTGDGTNDAPALKRADVGLAMGIAGTEVAKEASKIVLLDDAFATIVLAVRWGRSLSENIQRFLQFQLTINFSALLTTFLGILLFNLKAPFTVLQLLWINVIMDTLASIALCSEPPRREVMDLPPKRRDENILTPAMRRTIFTTGSFFVVVMLGMLLLMRGSPETPGLFAGTGPWLDDPGEPGEPAQFSLRQVSLFFSVYVFFQVWNLINCRSLRPEQSGWTGLFRNPIFLAIAAGVALGQIAIVSLGGKIFKVEPLSPLDWLSVIGFTSSVLVFAEIVRRLSRR